MVWTCAVKRRHWLGEEMQGIWGGGRAPKGRKMAAKRWVLGVCNGYNELVFLCNGTDRLEITVKTSIAVLCIEPSTENFPLRGDFAPKPPFWGSFNGSPCDRPTGQRVMFCDLAKLPPSTWSANGMPTPNRLVRLNVSAVEDPRITQISISER